MMLYTILREKRRRERRDEAKNGRRIYASQNAHTVFQSRRVSVTNMYAFVRESINIEGRVGLDSGLSAN